MRTNYLPWISATAFFLALAIPAYFIMEAEPATYEAPEPAPCEIECLIDRRTEEVFQRDLGIYREQARLTAMLEINAELQTLVYPK